jgi:hypothetical protein
VTPSPLASFPASPGARHRLHGLHGLHSLTPATCSPSPRVLLVMAHLIVFPYIWKANPTSLRGKLSWLLFGRKLLHAASPSLEVPNCLTDSAPNQFPVMASQCPVGLDCSRSPSVALSVAPVFVLAILAVVARAYSRYLTGHNRTASDFTIIAGLIFSAALTGMIFYGERRVLNPSLLNDARLTIRCSSPIWIGSTCDTSSLGPYRRPSNIPLCRLYSLCRCDSID